jgi:hypothetical protein
MVEYQISKQNWNWNLIKVSYWILLKNLKLTTYMKSKVQSTCWTFKKIEHVYLKNLNFFSLFVFEN